MLRTKVLLEILNEANTQGVKASVLIRKDGKLMASAGIPSSAFPSQEPGSSLPLGGVGREPDAVRQSSDIAAFIWQSYLQQGTALRLAESCDQVALSSVLVECQEGHLAMQPMARGELLLCMFASPDTAPGLLLAKLDALARFLDEQLSQITPQPAASPPSSHLLPNA